MFKCNRCNADHDGTYGSGKFCSRACANKREYSEEQKQKIYSKVGNALRGKPFKVNGIAPNMKPRIKTECICIVCKGAFIFEGTVNAKPRKTCSDKCAYDFKSVQGRNSAKVQGENRRSKNEKLLADMCTRYFPNVSVNEQIFDGWDADIILNDSKIAILWNGKWHYEKITEKHSVKQVQNRDALKIKAILANGFIPYIIKDMGGFNPKFVEEQFGELVNWLSRGPHKAK